MNGGDMFLVIDGLDGAGKTTQRARLAEWLRGRGHPVVECRDPGSTRLGDRVRELLLQDSECSIEPRAEMLLFMAARSQLVHEVIQPSLQSGAIVVCDRYQMATLAYQGHGGGVPLDEIRRVGATATGGLEPDHTFVLDAPPSSTLSRLERGLDRMESRGKNFFEKVRAGFLAEAARLAQRCTVVDALQGADDVAAAIRTHVDQLLTSPRPSAEMRK
jgi:dTMP kinase